MRKVGRIMALLLCSRVGAFVAPTRVLRALPLARLLATDLFQDVNNNRKADAMVKSHSAAKSLVNRNR